MGFNHFEYFANCQYRGLNLLELYYTLTFEGWLKFVGQGPQLTIPIQVKVSCFIMIKQVLSFIHAHLFWCMVSHNKHPDFQFDKKC